MCIRDRQIACVIASRQGVEHLEKLFPGDEVTLWCAAIDPETVSYTHLVGEHSHDNDLVINVTKSKKLTNMRASGSDDKARLIPPDVYKRQDEYRLAAAD